MFKCLSGDFPLTMAHNGEIITWGFGKDKTINLKEMMASFEILSQGEKEVEFKCTLMDGRFFTAKADLKRVDGIQKIFDAKQSSATIAEPSAPEYNIDFDGIIAECGSNRIEAVKMVKDLTGLDLRGAKEVTDREYDKRKGQIPASVSLNEKAADPKKPSLFDAILSNKTYGIRKCTYCGGLPNLTKQCDLTIKVTSAGLHFSAGLLKSYDVPIDAIKSCSFKSEEQISKDVTLTRLILFGIFAFGLKKKKKETTNFLVLTYEDCGIEVTVILTGAETVKLNSDIIKARKDSYKPEPATESASAANNTGDVYADIEKLHTLMEKGILTPDEFESKKKQLLNI